MTTELNSAFENVHPQVKVIFTELGVEKYEVKIEVYTDQGKFARATSQELDYIHLKDERFPAMVKGSAKSFSGILAAASDLDSLLETLSPSELIVEHVLSDRSLSSVDDFAARLGTISERKKFLAEEYIFKKARKAGIDPEGFSENELKALTMIGSFQLVHTSPSMEELSTALSELAHAPRSWPLLAMWIKEWAGASQWSYNHAWKGGPLIEELLAYGTYILLEKQGGAVEKQEWWHQVTLIFDFTLDINPDDLKRSGFIVN